MTGSLGTEANKCATQWGTKPNFVLVDFWNVAGPIAAVDALNGITASGRTSVSQAVLSQLTSGAGRVVNGETSRWVVAGAVLVAVAGMNVVYL